MYQTIISENNVTKWIEICAWCDADKKVTDSYTCRGYKASHGICIQHRDEVMKETIEYYEKNGFSIGDDDASKSDGLQHDSDFVI
jgi:hypothetical protein